MEDSMLEAAQQLPAEEKFHFDYFSVQRKFDKLKQDISPCFDWMMKCWGTGQEKTETALPS